MKFLQQTRLPIAWSVLVLVVCAAALVVYKVGVIDAPPEGGVVITSDQSLDVSSAMAGSAQSMLEPTPVETMMGLSNTVRTPHVVATSILTGAVMVTLTPVAPQPTATPELIAVYVSGAVQQPGVYTLPVGSRVNEAINVAGGPSNEANLEAVNLAARLVDEEHVIVPRISDTPVPATAQPKAGQPQPTRRAANTPARANSPQPQAKTTPSDKININTATAEELQSLPGVGPAISERIIAYRETYGPFETVEDIMRVPGIKEVLFGKIRDYITVGP